MVLVKGKWLGDKVLGPVKAAWRFSMRLPRRFPLNSGKRVVRYAWEGYAASVHSSWRTFLIAALATIATLAAFGASSALAAPKEIAYVCKGEDICLLDPDNPSAVTNLTDNGTTSYDEDPTWSPDGKRIAFVAKFSSKGEENIYTMEPEAPEQTFNIATQITHFTNGVVPTGEIAWSPNGSKLAFVRGANNFGSNLLYVVNADGTSANATEIPTTGGGGTPSWSADSGKIAFWHNNQIYTVPADLSSAVTALPGATCTEPAWSPDGSKIACGREF